MMVKGYIFCHLNPLMSSRPHSLNGSLPSNVEIKNNTLFFKGPVTYDLAGTYVCDATNGIGTRTGIVDVNITGKCLENGGVVSAPVTPAWLRHQYSSAPKKHTGDRRTPGRRPHLPEISRNIHAHAQAG